MTMRQAVAWTRDRGDERLFQAAGRLEQRRPQRAQGLGQEEDHVGQRQQPMGLVDPRRGAGSEEHQGQADHHTGSE